MVQGFLTPDANNPYGNYMGPEATTQNALAQQLMGNATKEEPVRGWGQALAKVLQGGLAGYVLGHNADEAQTNLKSAPGELAKAMSSAAEQWTDPDTGQKVGPDKMANMVSLTGASDNPLVNQAGPQIALKNIEDTMKFGNDVKLKNIEGEWALKAAQAKANAEANSIYGTGGSTTPPPAPAPTGSLMPPPPANAAAAPSASPPGQNYTTPQTGAPTRPVTTGNIVADKALLEEYGKGVGKAAAEAPAQAESKTTLDSIFTKMSDRFNKLDKLGGTPGHGVVSYLSNTEGMDLPFGLKTIGGQDIARMRGTPEQTIREELQGDIGDVKSAYQKASGLTSKQLDSNQEMQQFMRSLPNLLKQNKSNQARIADMSERFANSVAKAKIEAQGQGDNTSAPASNKLHLASPEDISHLKANPTPDEKSGFDGVYGPGAADAILGPQSNNALPIDGEAPVVNVQGQGGPFVPLNGPEPSANAQQSLNSRRMTSGTDPEIIDGLARQMKAHGRTDAQIRSYMQSKGLI